MEKFKEKTLYSNTVFQGNILNVRVDQVKLPDENESTREIVEHSGGVTILPVTKNEEIIMVKQYRKPAEQVLLELPAGTLETAEIPEKCAQRELIEETGYKTDNMKKLFSFYTSPGYSDELLHLFAGEVYKYQEQDLDEGEFVEVVIINKSDIMDLISSNKIQDGKTIMGLLYYLHNGI